MRRIALALAAFASFGTATPAAASITIYDFNNPLGGSGVLFDDQSASTVIYGSIGGGTNNFIVASGAPLVSVANVISGSTLNPTGFDFGIGGGGLFDNFVFDLLSDTGGSLIIDVVDDQLQLTEQITTFGPGFNFFSIDATNGESIKHVTVTATSGSFTDVRDIRATLVSSISAVPEPASWALMLLGFVAMASLRKSRIATQRSSAGSDPLEANTCGSWVRCRTKRVQ